MTIAQRFNAGYGRKGGNDKPRKRRQKFLSSVTGLKVWLIILPALKRWVLSADFVLHDLVDLFETRF